MRLFRELTSFCYTLEYRLRAGERRRVTQPLSHSNVAGSFDLAQQQLQEIGTALHRCPYWFLGHLMILKSSLELRDFSLAQASALAIYSLSQNQNHRDFATFQRARVEIAAADFTAALATLDQIVAPVHSGIWQEFAYGITSVSATQIAEERIAALIGLQRLSEAREIVKSLDPSTLSFSAQSAYDFLAKTGDDKS